MDITGTSEGNDEPQRREDRKESYFYPELPRNLGGLCAFAVYLPSRQNLGRGAGI